MTNENEVEKTPRELELEAEVARMREEGAATAQRQDMMLDALAELHEKMQKLEERQDAEPKAIPGGVVDARSKIERELDLEHAALREEFKDYSGWNLIERRALTGMIDSSSGLRLKADPEDVTGPDDPRRVWKIRWANLSVEGRAEEILREGWVKVQREELADQDAVPVGDGTDTYVRRGDRGREVLYKKPMKLFLYERKRTAARRKGELQSESFMRNKVANGVAGLAGKAGDNADQAGSMVADKKQFIISVEPTETETFTA